MRIGFRGYVPFL